MPVSFESQKFSLGFSLNTLPLDGGGQGWGCYTSVKPPVALNIRPTQRNHPPAVLIAKKIAVEELFLALN